MDTVFHFEARAITTSGETIEFEINATDATEARQAVESFSGIERCSEIVQSWLH